MKGKGTSGSEFLPKMLPIKNALSVDILTLPLLTVLHLPNRHIVFHIKHLSFLVEEISAQKSR